MHSAAPFVCGRPSSVWRPLVWAAALCSLLAATPSLLSAQSYLVPPVEADGAVVREIRISGLNRIREDYVRDVLASQEGEPYRRRNLEIDRERLDRLGVFNSQEVKAIQVGDDVDKN